MLCQGHFWGVRAMFSNAAGDKAMLLNLAGVLLWYSWATKSISWPLC